MLTQNCLLTNILFKIMCKFKQSIMKQLVIILCLLYIIFSPSCTGDNNKNELIKEIEKHQGKEIKFQL